jgi:DNA mismatch endonuclease (patch repair protein)
VADTLTPSARSERMSRIKSKNTGVEMAVRRLLTSLGYRYRLHRKDLPGKPDIVFPGRRAAIFVHGCFWHLHDCGRYKLPQSRVEFWSEKLSMNVARDTMAVEALDAAGWRVRTVWECELRDLPRLTRELRRFLGPEQACP